MAIQIEQEKKPINWVGIATVGVIILSMFGGVYFVFFSRPDVFVDVFVPPQLEQLERITSPPFSPQEFAESSEFKNLQDYGPPINVPPAGRDNPFIPPER